MGFLRLLLAASVIIGHAGGIAGYAVVGGAIAVQCFYIISGFFITLVLHEKYNLPEMNRTFYINRFLRIYGVYYIFLLLYVALNLLAGLFFPNQPMAMYLSNEIDAPARAFLALLNLTVIGQDIPLFLRNAGGHLAFTLDFHQSSPRILQYMIITPAWSLSLELLFYIMAPFLVRGRSWVLIVIFAASMVARVIGHAHGLRNDPWSYRFFPFEIGMFLLGALSYKAYARYRATALFARLKPVGLLLPVLVMLYPLVGRVDDNGSFFVPQRIALLLLTAAALPLLFAMTGRWKVDRLIGELSFPMYLGHMLIMHVVLRIHAIATHVTVRSVVVLVATIGLAALVTYTVDIPINAFRQRLALRARRDALAGGSEAVVAPRGLSSEHDLQTGAAG